MVDLALDALSTLTQGGHTLFVSCFLFPVSLKKLHLCMQSSLTSPGLAAGARPPPSPLRFFLATFPPQPAVRFVRILFSLSAFQLLFSSS